MIQSGKIAVESYDGATLRVPRNVTLMIDASGIVSPSQRICASAGNSAQTRISAPCRKPLRSVTRAMPTTRLMIAALPHIA